ncbi:MAG: 30S ribosomal protein S18 [candidate division WOR-3 bacterium]|nr:30S ribosomal protein S18 [candidate division WOR-3 bacterium]MCR4423643.1 30S ribosomal protein S18 [candidate division WOR-3 bacterium]MDH7518982.1 30S ribosomal protein S18 [bacterium]
MSTKRFTVRTRACPYCAEGVTHIDYKDPRLKDFLTDRGKIVSSRVSGLCARHQRRLAKAIKRARTMGLLPFITIQV